MNLLTGPVAVAALLLIAASVTKVVHPEDTSRALKAAGVPVSPLLVRIGAVAESCIGLAALIIGGTASLATMAASYACFAVFVVIALAKHTPVSTCGCFGKADSPPAVLHILLSLLFSVACAGATVAGVHRGITESIIREGPAGALIAAFALLGTYTSFLAMTELPKLSGVRRRAAP